MKEIGNRLVPWWHYFTLRASRISELKFLAEQVLPCVRVNTSEAVDLIGVHVAVQVAVARVATGQEM